MRRLGLTKKCSGFRLPSGLSIGNFNAGLLSTAEALRPAAAAIGRRFPAAGFRSCRRGGRQDQPQAPVERPAVSERSQDEAKGLERQLPEDGQQILKAGDESFLTLWLPANTAEAEGVVILVPGDGESRTGRKPSAR